jgi:hypothetical protein
LPRSGFLSVPVDEFKGNLAGMLAAARKAGVPHILLITPPPVDEEAWAKTVSDAYCMELARFAMVDTLVRFQPAAV